MKKSNIKKLCLTAIFTALIYVFTAYFHIPSHNGYIHIGDAFLYLAACILPIPYAAFAGAAGACLADLLSGFAVWAPGSAIIKALTVLFFSSKSNNIISKRNLIAVFPSAVVCCGGYYLYEALIYWNFIAPIAGIIGSIIQSSLSGVLFIALGISFDKINIKNHLGE